QIYGRALTPTEIREVFNAGNVGAGNCADCARQPANMAVWYKGDGNTNDSAGANNGTLFGGASATADGIVGQAFQLSGNGQGVVLPNAPALQTQNFSIDAWIKRDSLTQVSDACGGGLLFGYGQDGYGLGIGDGRCGLPAGQLLLSKIGVSAVHSSNLTVDDTAFHHVAVTVSGGQVIFFVDGVADGPYAYAPGYTFATNPAVGIRADNNDNSFKGVIDEIQVFNRALSAAEIERIYRAGSRGTCPCLPGAGTLAFTSSRQDVSEGVGSLAVTVRRYGGSNGPASVDYATSNIRATAPGDYATQTGTLSWAAGDTASKSFTLPIANDSTGELAEDLRITLSGAACALQGLGTQTVFIADDDPGVRLVSSAIDVNENTDTQAVVSVERLAGNLGGALDLGFATANGAALAGLDYSASSGTLHWNGGVGGIMTITVPLINDALAENQESFQVSLGTPSVGNIVGASSASVRIAANDPGVQLVSTSQTTGEGAGSVQVLVRRVPHDISGALSVDFGTANGNALAGADYTSASGTLSWITGEPADKPVNVSISDDGTPEATENFKFNLSNPVGGSILGKASAMISITDNDSGVQMVTTDVAINEGAGTVTVLVTRTGGDTSGAVTASWATGESSARAADFTGATGSVSWAAGEPGPKSIVIAITDDAIDEPAEVFTVRLTSATGAGIVSPTFTRVTIADNDP
ncbi:MAG TPA: Calx-beta domain-containing protein, partial [Solimonas sp.]|nr:Calx-beta domain-containing protein [Solimonas sp.]